jgi:hypothetical protein
MKNILPVILVLVFGCSEEETTTREYPRLLTRGVSHIAADGTAFNAEITGASVEILDHGFVWSGTDYDPSLENADIISLGSRNRTGAFQATADRCMKVGTEYTMRPYAVSSDYIVYGEAVDFISMGSKNKVQVSSFQPTTGNYGEEVVIRGDFFSAVKTQNKVSFGDYNAEVVSAKQSEITVRIPAFDPAKSSVNITIEVEGSTAVFEEKFSFELPDIQSISPSSATITRTLVEINGSGFGSSAAFLDIKFADKVCIVKSFSATKILIQLPPDAPVGSYPITITRSGILEQSSSNLTSVSPWTSQNQKADIFVNGTVAPIVIGDKVYVRAAIDEFWEYDIDDRIWLRKADATFNNGGVSFALHDKAYFVGEDTHVYNPATNNWSSVPAPNFDFNAKASVSFNNAGFVFLSTLQGGVQRYDPLTDEWISLTQASASEYYFGNSGGFLIGNTMYVGVGSDSGGQQRKFWKYNVENEIWTELKSFPGNAIYSPISFEINGKGYLGGGYQS